MLRRLRSKAHSCPEISGDAYYTTLLAQMAPWESGFTVDDFISRCEEDGVEIRQPEEHKTLFNDIRILDKDGKNGIWTRIIKNAFAPLFIGSVDFVAGNPPWINWDSLPEDYRNATKLLWVKHKLFSLSGSKGRLGGGKKDISMLFVYEGVRSYLNQSGRLGYVITQSIFKTEGAGDGFRQFQLQSESPGGRQEPFCVYKVDDLSHLKPFEGATNRTAIICIRRGSKTEYPIDYPYWVRSEGPAAIPEGASLDEVLSSTERIGLKAAPIYKGKATAPWLSVCPSVLESLHKVVGAASYKAQAGATTCGADGVFLVRALRKVAPKATLIENLGAPGRRARAVEQREGRVADEYLYPVCRGKDVARWRADPDLLVLMLQDPSTRVGVAETALRPDLNTRWEKDT